ncbi:THUMP domain-containing protein 2 [Pempheris klunzingeri]|uniref:THUMP domain-containing protein 2 n=1 Tax=Pempheris klunzingeri TaxID=3127111 RepID=UPI0039803CEB
MAEMRSEGGLVRYYCTAGNGMEPFLIEEVKTRLAAEDVCQVPGKVLFSSSAGINRVRELKAAERLFLLLRQDSPVRLSAHTSPAKAASALQSTLLGDSNQWTSAVMTWSRLQGELADRRTTAKTPSTTPRMTRKMEEGGSEEEDKCAVETRKSAEGQRKEESGNRIQMCGEQNGAQTLEKRGKREKGEKEVERVSDVERKREKEMSGETCIEAQTLEKKRKRDEEEEEDERSGAAQGSCCEQNVEKEKISERERRRRKEEEERGMVMEFSSCRKNSKHGVISGTDFNDRGHTTPGLDHNVESSSRTMDDMTKDFAVESVDNVIKKPIKTTGGRDETPSRIESKTPSVPVSFRISCKCTGFLSRYFSSQEVSKVMGVGLSRLLGWKADLKNPQLEIHVYLSDDHCLLGIPLTRLPLANRSYIKTTGLRSTVAWAMASLAHIQPGFCVVDPMCGVGTILIEAAQENKAATFLGMDIDDGQLRKAKENVQFAELGNRIQLLKASSMVLPLPSASVDAVVCDLPFGRKFGTKTNMAANLPLILTEMERVLCVGGTLVLLLSPQLSCLLKNLLAQKDTGSASNQETKAQTGTQDCPSSHPHGVVSPPAQETGPQAGLQHSLPPPLSSLKHQATLRVSLGTIDGLIHKYVKMDT